jgi:cellulose synthase/poly-beta-1,6-N-acetylglucosamine synthase-like glycosyltransferase
MEEKLTTTLQTSYPLERLEILIGSDASTDQTNAIIRRFAALHPVLRLVEFTSRSGKISIINELAKQAGGEILLLTDANVFFTPDTLGELIRHFEKADLAVVGGNIVNPETLPAGIARQESGYQKMENLIKFREGVLWGAMMGAFGGCYAVRKSFFSPTPQNFIVDDFYLTLAALERGGKAIAEPAAVCYEDVSHHLKEEFRRKSRIGAGNFQILQRFSHLLSPRFGGIAFAFFSHKVLRWIGPFLLIAAYLSSFALAFHRPFYLACFIVQNIFILLAILDYGLSQWKIHLAGLRYLTHFYGMNAALLNGFFKYLSGIEHNVWQPTQRNQAPGNK